MLGPAEALARGELVDDEDAAAPVAGAATSAGVDAGVGETSGAAGTASGAPQLRHTRSPAAASTPHREQLAILIAPE
ncbi:MAG TPA: hypothetical protein VF916_15590 [Ktedonobacterales bacterium]